ncbi:MAG TPA: UDP-glucose/GDP-mannose dehydrogenase family protein [Gammaproteobacteria bacterium]|nr:UDP-glucose 6-dehydrogenase TuaD [bacterium BMS3Abin11]GMT41382.1 MAG: UDP-glucose 6-dehydrogenase [bacterium]HDH15612.1 UDP-glucose/GDP-mannose dehydrogenase family protein [Gammaproteobacteria bacterium]HDZ78652.1 UDP-glucose/GDP-mannose dehydrogenase family protein [Gammaproteobacteria bacterium]
MKVTVIGTGYVGLVSGTCLAEVGNNVVCVDIDQSKIDMLNNGEIPIYEPGLEDLVKKNVDAGRLSFTSDIEAGVGYGSVLFIAVGTPPDEDGSADLKHVLAVASDIGKHMNDFRVVVTKSTVPVGTADKVRDAVSNALQEKGASTEFSVVSNPEFLKEGAAVEDFLKPDRIVVGADDDRAIDMMRELYAPFNRNHERIIVMDIRSAEMTKYAANAMLATKISFMNEMANLAELLGADIENVRHGIGADPRIGYYFIYPGCGYGGSCFPKDVQALHRTAKAVGYDAQILDAVEAVNKRQKSVLVDKIVKRFGDDLQGKKFAVWGLAFKPETDDMREAPSRTIMEALWQRGATIAAYDPVAEEEVERIYGNRDDLTLVAEPYDALDDADGLIVATEWKVFRSPDLESMMIKMKTPVIFDGRNIFQPATIRKAGFEYFGIGR